MSRKVEFEALGEVTRMLLELVSLEMKAEGIRTVTGTESYVKRIPDFDDATAKLRAPTAVRSNRIVSRLALDDLNEGTGSRGCKR